MKLRYLFLLFLALPAAAAAPPPAPLFHRPQAEAERALDWILATNARERNILARIDKNNHNPIYSATLARKYAGWFTPALLKNVFAQESLRLKRECRGRYGADCGFNFDALSCTQSSMDPPFVYLTQKEGRNMALVSYAWPPHLQEKGAATYRLVKNGRYWAIDGITCNYSGQSFNMPPVP